MNQLLVGDWMDVELASVKCRHAGTELGGGMGNAHLRSVIVSGAMSSTMRGGPILNNNLRRKQQYDPSKRSMRQGSQRFRHAPVLAAVLSFEVPPVVEGRILRG